MARFSSIICGSIFLVLSLTAAYAQATQPVFPGRRQQPNPNQSAPMNPPVSMQQRQPAVATPQTVQQPNQQQPNQQQVNRPVDPPATGPAAAPVVTYRDGLLAVQAVNSNLTSVITAIRNKTGIEFEGVDSVPDRVVLSLGPAPAAEVLSAIFSGSKFDFVAIGRPDSPSIVQRVILTRKTQPGAVAATQPQPRPNNGEGDEEDVPDEQVNAGGGDPQDVPVQPVPAPQAQPQTQNQQQEQPKTPEQLLQELQQMRQQQKQPADDQNPSQAPRKPPR
ncbi:MAG: hypothetical protein WA738_16655 [Candidatus Angelobacter sp.]